MVIDHASLGLRWWIKRYRRGRAMGKLVPEITSCWLPNPAEPTAFQLPRKKEMRLQFWRASFDAWIVFQKQELSQGYLHFELDLAYLGNLKPSASAPNFMVPSPYKATDESISSYKPAHRW